MSHQADHHHVIIPLRYLVGTFLSLLSLTVVTVLASLIDFGSFLNLVVALGIAALKAFLVLSIFMGLKWDGGYNRMVVLGSFLFIGIFLVFTIADVAFRGSIDAEEKQVFGIHSPVKSPSESVHH